MENQISCEQVGALLTFYVENKLSKKLTEYVKIHLENCPICMQKYIELQNILKKYKNIKNNELNNQYFTQQYEDFKLNLSAYVDNELNNNENIKIKKITITNPLARQDLENIYNFKKLLHSSFEKTKNDIKYDYSKIILNTITKGNKKNNEISLFIKLSTVLAILITLLISSLIGLLYF